MAFATAGVVRSGTGYSSSSSSSMARCTPLRGGCGFSISAACASAQSNVTRAGQGFSSSQTTSSSHATGYLMGNWHIVHDVWNAGTQSWQSEGVSWPIIPVWPQTPPGGWS